MRKINNTLSARQKPAHTRTEEKRCTYFIFFHYFSDESVSAKKPKWKESIHFAVRIASSIWTSTRYCHMNKHAILPYEQARDIAIWTGTRYCQYKSVHGSTVPTEDQHQKAMALYHGPPPWRRTLTSGNVRSGLHKVQDGCLFLCVCGCSLCLLSVSLSFFCRPQRSKL